MCSGGHHSVTVMSQRRNLWHYSFLTSLHIRRFYLASMWATVIVFLEISFITLCKKYDLSLFYISNLLSFFLSLCILIGNHLSIIPWWTIEKGFIPSSPKFPLVAYMAYKVCFHRACVPSPLTSQEQCKILSEENLAKWIYSFFFIVLSWFSQNQISRSHFNTYLLSLKGEVTTLS